MKRILITGASSGIGAATALHLDRCGMEVFAATRAPGDGQVALTRAALPLLRKASGRIVFVGSVGGRLAAQFAGAYHASKFAMEAIADVWRQELEPEELSVILVEPSAISTPIWDKEVARLDALLADVDPRLVRYRDRLREFQESLRSADEHGKPPEDVAATIEQALTEDSPDTRYVVGASGKL